MMAICSFFITILASIPAHRRSCGNLSWFHGCRRLFIGVGLRLAVGSLSLDGSFNREVLVYCSWAIAALNGVLLLIPLVAWSDR